MDTILDRIDKYLEGEQDFISEAFLPSMTSYFDKKILSQLGNQLNWIGLDVQKSTFKEFEKDSLTPGKMKDNYIICGYGNGKAYAVVRQWDKENGSDLYLGMSFRRMYGEKHSKKSLIKKADKIWVCTGEAAVDSFALKNARRAAKIGATALQRGELPNWDTELDKSGYDVTAARKELSDKLFLKHKEERIKVILDKASKLTAEVVALLYPISNGTFNMKWNEFYDVDKKVRNVLPILSNIFLKVTNKDGFTESNIESLEKALGIK